VDLSAWASTVPVSPLRAILYWRHCFLPPDPHAQDPLSVRADSGRWATPEGTLYLADSETTMWCEYLRNTAAQVQRSDPTGGLSLARAEDVRALAGQPLVEMPPRGVWVADVQLERVANLTGGRSQIRPLDPAGLFRYRASEPSAEQLIADDYGPCPDIAALHTQLGWQAVISYSAALPSRFSVAVFKPHFPARERLKLRALAAQPTVLHAALTRYPDRQRPTWLPPPAALARV
jgi:hypothetical protein